MTNEKWLTICQVLIFIGAITTASATLGAWWLSDLIQKVKDAKEIQESNSKAQNDAKKAAEQAYLGTLKFDKKKQTNDATKIESNKSPMIEIGPSGTIFKLDKGNILSLDYICDTKGLDFYLDIEDNQIKISVQIRDSKGVIIAELIKNEWRINRNNYWDRNYTSDALEVKGRDGDIVLQAMVFKDRVRLQAKLYDINGKGVALTSRKDGLPGSELHNIGPKHPMSAVYIKPIFKYPSETHLGETIK